MCVWGLSVFCLSVITSTSHRSNDAFKRCFLQRSIKVATDPELGRVRLEIISLPVLSLEDKKLKPEEDYQPKLDLGEED